MRTDVITFFQNPPENPSDQFNKAFELYRRSDGKSIIAERTYNSSGYTKQSLENLLYDLQKLHNISDLEKIPVADVQVAQDFGVMDQLCMAIRTSNNQDVLYFLKIGADYPDFVLPEDAPQGLAYFLQLVISNAGDFFKAFVEEHNLLEMVDVKELLQLLQYEISSTVLPEAIVTELDSIYPKSSPGDVPPPNTLPLNAEVSDSPGTLSTAGEDSLKLREQYPFLNDPECPNEFKILVADKITHYNKYKEAHARLQAHQEGTELLSEEDLPKVTEASVSHFEQNRLINLELDHYAAEKKVLGEHPLFAQLALQREVDEMTEEQLKNFVRDTPSYISKKNSAIKAAASDDRKLKLQAAIDERNAKLALVNKRLVVK